MTLVQGAENRCFKEGPAKGTSALPEIRLAKRFYFMFPMVIYRILWNRRTADMNSQGKIAKFIQNIKEVKIPENVLHDISYRIVDWLGCAALGKNYPQTDIARQLINEFGGTPEVHVIGSRRKASLLDAVFINGIMGHVAELDDGHRLAIGHPGSIALPVALAFGERFACTGEEFLKAVVIGYEVFIRLGRTVNPSHYRYWHTTGTCGVFAAAAVAAYFLGLDERKTVNALGIAGTTAAGLQETFGSYAKALNIGQACRNGSMAALLAQRGFTGPDDILMGSKGFVNATSTAASGDLINAIDNMEYLSTTAFYKIYASCGHTNSPLDAVLALLNGREIHAEEIERILVETYKVSVDLTGTLKCDTEDQAKFSLPYCIALAILYGRVALSGFKEEIRKDEHVLCLARKVKVIEDAGATEAFPARWAKVTIFFKNQSSVCKEVSGSNDAPDYEQIEDKFISAMLASGYKEGTARTILRLVLSLRGESCMAGLFNEIYDI